MLDMDLENIVWYGNPWDKEYGPTWSLEDLYQQFKQRLLSELYIEHKQDSGYYGEEYNDWFLRDNTK